ncbi:uncharacterized protein LOC127078914 [Lathyrus oleraceus]|uniref:uncharacterized protein LOC127078914 n=1 Tax=Pisum sativum TaxID=3888 RepID=UPI0021D00A8F|nr:uncharacterized protein LOC127078914 [Pisum sativum]
MQMFVNGLKINTKQLIDTAAGGSTNFSTATSIKKAIEVITVNEHLELYDICVSKLEGVIDLKLETNKIRIEDIIAAKVEKKLKAINIGASVSLMPLSIYKKRGIGVVQDTRMTLQFADHSVKKPYVIVEDIIVKIDKFVFPVDFVILEMPEDEEIPFIPGRPFLETGRCLINIEEVIMTLKVYDEELKIDV